MDVKIYVEPSCSKTFALYLCHIYDLSVFNVMFIYKLKL